MTEHVEAVMFMRAVRGAEAEWPELRWLFAVPNGGWRAKRTAAAMKAEGAKPGVPDYILPVQRGEHVGLAVELKTATGRVRPEQREWLAALEEQGWHASVARGWEQAWDVVRDYMALEPPQTAQEASAGCLPKRMTNEAHMAVQAEIEWVGNDQRREGR